MKFVDFTKELDSLDHSRLWKILRHGLPSEFAHLIKVMHEDSFCNVIDNELQSIQILLTPLNLQNTCGKTHHILSLGLFSPQQKHSTSIGSSRG